MITFFRRIRKSLLGSGQARKYLLYAIGEIALVVIGILIALQINNWNESRKEQSIKSDYLLRLEQDLEKHIHAYKENIDFCNNRFYSIDYVLKRLEYSRNDLEKDSMIIHLNSMQWLGNLRVDLNFYEDLIATGNIKFFTENDIRLGIQEYYHLIVKYKQAIATNNQFYLENGLRFYTKHLEQGYIIRSLSGVDKPFQTIPSRQMFKLWNKGYHSDEMMEFENNLYFRRVDLSTEVSRNSELQEKAKSLLHKIRHSN